MTEGGVPCLEQGEEWPLHGWSTRSLPTCSPAQQNLSPGMLWQWPCPQQGCHLPTESQLSMPPLVPIAISPRKGGEGQGMQKAASFWWENSLFQGCGAVKEAQPAGKRSPGESTCPSLGVPSLGGGLGTVPPTGNCVMQCSGRAEAQPALGSLLAAPLGSLLRPHSSGAHEPSWLCHCWSWHWSSRGVGEGGTVTAQWERAAPGVGCPAAFLQHIPRRPWMCSVISKTQR